MIEVAFGSGLTPPDDALRRLVADRFASRLFARDAELWGPEAEAEARVRLGWTDSFERGDGLVAESASLRDDLHSAGIDRIVLSGMGGSSLAPEVICRRDRASLIVLDSTHPDQVRSALGDIARTALVVSSKSGSTVETRSHLTTFERAYRDSGIDPAGRIIVVTDPGSELESYATSAGYRVFLADPEVGGRYSALTAFGLVPSVLAGSDGTRLLEEAAAAHGALRADAAENPALRLAALLAAQLPERYIFGVSETGAGANGLPDWIEQLIAESTGKEGHGVLPVALPADSPEFSSSAEALPPSMYLVEARAGQDPTAVPTELRIAVSGPLGAQFLLWETATAALSRLIGVNPFDQPDVESAKAAARTALADPSRGAGGARDDALEPAQILAELRRSVGSNGVERHGFLAIQAYLDRGADRPLEELRARLVAALGAPVSLGFGPRYLHSTGQFHKGGPERGAYLQIVERGVADLGIPGQTAGFAELIAAQAEGDRQILEQHGRTVARIGADQLSDLLREL